jgi:ribosomal protein L11 methyltransferase
MSVHISPEADVDKIWEKLEYLGLQILYSSEDEEGLKVLYVTAENIPDLSGIKNVVFTAPFTLPEIDWVQQFQDHGLNFQDGYVHVDLRDFGCLTPLFNPIKIEPGPGFGDLSHPTTKLVLKLMSDHVKNKHVLDIGCGSGILSLAASSMGSTSCFGVDIDVLAIQHSYLNAKLNNIEHLVSFGKAFDYKPSTSPNSLVVLMNMIESEQRQALESLKIILQIPGDCIISGILQKDKDRYLAWTKTLNWKLISEIEMEGWLGLHFTRFNRPLAKLALLGKIDIF